MILCFAMYFTEEFKGFSTDVKKGFWPGFFFYISRQEWFTLKVQLEEYFEKCSGYLKKSLIVGLLQIASFL